MRHECDQCAVQNPSATARFPSARDLVAAVLVPGREDVRHVLDVQVPGAPLEAVEELGGVDARVGAQHLRRLWGEYSLQVLQTGPWAPPSEPDMYQGRVCEAVPGAA